MLDSYGFDTWAGDYDRCVMVSDERGTYPFAGYQQVLVEICRRIFEASEKTILDIGFGTGTLSYALYKRGCKIFGQDFSREMIEAAQEKMPDALLYRGDFSERLADELKNRQYDAIVATYSLHHLTDEQKEKLIGNLAKLVRNGGHIYIGDIAFETREALEACKAQAGEEWDDDENYFVFSEWERRWPGMVFVKASACAGVLIIGC